MSFFLSFRSAWRRPRAVLSLVGVLAVGLWLCGTGPAYASNIVKAMFYQLVGIGGTSQTQRNRLNLVAGTNITLTPADNSGTNSTDVTIDASSGSTVFYQLLGIGGSSQTQRNRLNLVAGSNITLTPSDNGGTNSSDVTIAAAAGSTVALTEPFVTADGGTTYFGPVWRLYRPTDYGSFSWQNQGASTVTSSNGALFFEFPSAAATADVHSYLASLPGGTSWTAEALYTITGGNINNQYCGIGLRESATSKITMIGSRANQSVRQSSYTNDTSGPTASGYEVSWASVNNVPLWVQIVRNGATLSYAIGANLRNQKVVYSAATTVFFTTAPDQIGISCDVSNGSNGNVFMSLLSLRVY